MLVWGQSSLKMENKMKINFEELAVVHTNLEQWEFGEKAKEEYTQMYGCHWNTNRLGTWKFSNLVSDDTDSQRKSCTFCAQYEKIQF